jgi:hypothetical protein
VDVPDECGEDESFAGGGLGTYCIDNMLSEVGVESCGGGVGSHLDGRRMRILRRMRNEGAVCYLKMLIRKERRRRRGGEGGENNKGEKIQSSISFLYRGL